MPYAVTLRLDADADAKVDRLLDRLGQAGVSRSRLALGYAAHVTLAILDGAVDEAALIRHVASASADMVAVRMTIAGLGVFPGAGGAPSCLWLAPVATPELRRPHGTVAAALPGGAAIHPHYADAAWVPHVTLADDLGSLAVAGQAVAALEGADFPGRCTLDRIEVVRFRPVEVLWTRSLPR